MELTLYNLAKEVAEKALNEITYEGKTLREWVEIIVKQDCISREDAKNLFWDGTEGYDCRGFTRMEIGEMLDDLPPVTPKTSCEACREQVLKHLEKEDWADTVNCVMNMPFINKPCVSEGVCHKDKMQVLDKIRAEIIQMPTISSNANDIYKADVLEIIDKYRTEERDE